MEKNLPSDMVVEVLLRLPARSLYRFRSVSKLWNSLLCSNFIRSRKENNCQKLYICFPKSHLSLDFYEANFDAPANSGLALTETKEYPFIKNSTSLLTSCDDWLLLGDRYTNKLWFLNPSTKDYEEFQGYYPRDDFSDISYGICCGQSRKEYRIVAVLWRTRYVSKPPVFNVFSIKSRSWVESRGFIRYIHSACRHGISVNGVPHWLYTYGFPARAGRKIICFDVKNEKFVEVPPPKQDFDGFDGTHFYLASMGENLAAYVVTVYQLKVWVMKEHGVQESWIQTFYLEIEDIYPVQPLIFTKKGELILLSWWGNELLIYNHRQDKYKTLIKFKGRIDYRIATYLDSSIISAIEKPTASGSA